MKKVLYLLLVIGLMAAGPASVSAEDGQVAYGYIQLNRISADRPEPVEIQARDDFERIAPILHAAQTMGNVIAFEPEFAFGFVKVKYHAGFDLASAVGMPVLHDMQSAVDASPAPRMNTQDYSALGGGGPQFWMNMGSSCFYAAYLGSGYQLIGLLYDRSGRMIAHFDDTADGSGVVNDCFSWFGPYASVHAGYKVVFKQYLGGIMQSTNSIIVPRLNINFVNKALAVAKGVAPAGISFTAKWYGPKLNAANDVNTVYKFGTVPSTGKWKVDFGKKRLRGRDYVSFEVLKGNFYFKREIRVPYVYCELGGNHCGSYGFPGKPASISILHGGTTYISSGRNDPWGWFGYSLFDTQGDPIYLVAGDQVSGVGFTTYKLPKLTAVPKPDTDKVVGRAPANKYFSTYLYDASASAWNFLWSHSNSWGRYAADYTGVVDIQVGSIYVMELYYIDRVTGNVTWLDKYAAP